MNTLFRHIEFLLTRHDCVIVPGLGAFIVTSLPAVIDRVNRRITPPSRSVMFNQAVAIDDGLLANSYARRLTLSFEEARQVILKDVALLFDSLHAEGHFKAGTLGTFSLGEENQVVFRPASSPIENAERNGLYSFVYPTRNNETLLTSEPIANLPAVDSEEKSTGAQYLRFRINRSVIRFTAVFILVAAVAFAVLMYPVPRDEREHRASVVPVEALIPTPHQVKAKHLPTEIPQITEAIPEQEKATEVVAPTPTVSEEHFLIVATFHSKKEAERFVQLYSTSEFPLETVSSRKVTRVYAASSTDRKELLSQLNSEKISKNFPNAWIWSSNN